MAVTRVGTPTSIENVASVPVPAGATTDDYYLLLICLQDEDDTPPLVASPGFTHRGSVLGTPNGLFGLHWSFQALTKPYVGDEGTDFSITGATTWHYYMATIARGWEGDITLGAVSVAVTTGLSIPGVTVPEDGSLGLISISSYNGGQTTTSATGWTKVDDGPLDAFPLLERALNSGATGDVAVTMATDERVQGWMVVLSPASGGGTGHTVDPIDNLGLTDSVTIALARAVTRVEPLGLTDTVALTRTEATVEALGLTDTVSVAVARGVTATDTLGLTDATVVSVTKLVTPVDLLSITDAVALARGEGAVDPLGLTDVAALDVDAVREFTDPLGITDQVQVELEASGEVNPNDVLGLTDAVTLTAVYVREFTDPLGLTDTAQVARTISLVLTESLEITDESSQVAGAAVTVVDQLGLIDSVVLAREIHLSIVDLFGVTDIADPEVTQSIIAVVDPLDLTDEVQLVRQVTLTFTDELGLTDIATNDGYPPTVITCATLTTVRIDLERTTEAVNEPRVISEVSVWERKQGDVRDFALVGIIGVESLAGAVITTTLRQRDVVIHPAADVFAATAEGNLPPIVRVDFALWLLTATTGTWKMEHDILFPDGASLTWPGHGYDEVIVSEALA